MSSTTPATFADVTGPRPENLLAANFLVSYPEGTRNSYALVLRQWFTWCYSHGIQPMDAKRPHIEAWMRQMEEVDGLKNSTICGKVGTLNMFYRTAVRDDYLMANPVEWVKRPSVPRQSTTNGLTRRELWDVLELAKQSSAQDHAILCVLGYNGLRVGELCAIQVENVSMMAGYLTIKIVREKSHETAVIPLAPVTSQAVQKVMFGRTTGPLFRLRGEVPMERRGVDRIVKRLCRKAGITKRVSPHSFRHTFITLSLDAGASVRDVQNSVGHADMRMVSYYDRAKTSLERNSTHLVSAWVEAN